MPAVTEQEARRLWREADAVCFDVDSTVIMEEGCDELARFLGKADEVQELTRRAMSGAMEFREALRTRLDLLRPTRSDVERFIGRQPLSVSPGIRELVQRLHARGVKVFLVSGGFDCLIRPVAASLGIPAENVTANRLLFDFYGDYVGFDETQPTSASGGKARALQRLIDEHKLRCLAMVGDGATDLEAAPPAHVFIGYGGSVVRPKVEAGAPWFVRHFQELIDELPEST